MSYALTLRYQPSLGALQTWRMVSPIDVQMRLALASAAEVTVTVALRRSAAWRDRLDERVHVRSLYGDAWQLASHYYNDRLGRLTVVLADAPECVAAQMRAIP